MTAREFLYFFEEEKLVFFFFFIKPAIKNPMIFPIRLTRSIYRIIVYDFDPYLERHAERSFLRSKGPCGFPKRRASQPRCRAWIRIQRKRALDFMEPVPTVSIRARPLAPTGLLGRRYAYTLYAPERGTCS